jgi:hypothetical protein
MARAGSLRLAPGALEQDNTTTTTPATARESSLPAGPAPRHQNRNLCPNSRNHPRKLTPNSATFTRTGHHCLVHLKIARDDPRLLGFAI